MDFVAFTWIPTVEAEKDCPRSVAFNNMGIRLEMKPDGKILARKKWAIVDDDPLVLEVFSANREDAPLLDVYGISKIHKKY